MLLLTVTCMAILSTGARVTPTGFILRRTPLQILRESETQGATDFAPGTSGGAPTYWLYHDFHREVPAQVEATGWILAGNAADAAERAAAHHERWKEDRQPEDHRRRVDTKLARKRRQTFDRRVRSAVLIRAGGCRRCDTL